MSSKKIKDKSDDDRKPNSGTRHVKFLKSYEKIGRKESSTQHIIRGDSDASQSLLYERSHDLITDQEVNISVLNRYINAPLREVSSRSIFFKACSHLSSDLETKSVFSATSSTQLFEIVTNSPMYSDINLTLLSATYLSKLKEARSAIRSGADVNTVIEQQTALIIATESGDSRLVSYLLTVPNINLNFQNSLGHTPLILAVEHGFDLIVRMLLKHKADVNLQDNMGKTPLHCALFLERIGLVKLLLAFGADYEKSDCFGEKPMYTAAVKKPNLECLKALLKIGALPDYITVSGISLLSRTILNGTDFKIIEALVKYGASVNSQDRVSKKTPLHFAALMNDIKVAKFLVKEGADINLRTTYDFTPLDEASAQKSSDVKFFLIDLIDRHEYK